MDILDGLEEYSKTDNEIQFFLAELDYVIKPGWQSDGSIPARYMLKTYSGQVLATVDPWCGGYEDPNNNTIAWKIELKKLKGSGYIEEKGVVTNTSIAEMKSLCEDTIRQYLPKTIYMRPIPKGYLKWSVSMNGRTIKGSSPSVEEAEKDSKEALHRLRDEGPSDS